MTAPDRESLAAWFEENLTHTRFAEWSNEQFADALLAGPLAPPEPTSGSALAVVREQAEDDGLWLRSTDVFVAYMQQELRRLHAAVEADAARFGVRVETGPSETLSRTPLTITVVATGHQTKGVIVGVLAADLDALEADLARWRERAYRAFDAAMSREEGP